MKRTVLWLRRGGMGIVTINAIFTKANVFILIIAPKIHIYDHNLFSLVNAGTVSCSNKVNNTIEVNSSLTLELKCQIDSGFNVFYEAVMVLYHLRVLH